MPSSAAANKAKGRKHQQWIRDLMLALSPSLSKDCVVSRPMGSQGEDIMLSREARSRWPLSIEAKHQQTGKFLWHWMDQCRANAPEDALPVVIFKRNREDPLFIANAELMLRIISELPDQFIQDILKNPFSTGVYVDKQK